DYIYVVYTQKKMGKYGDGFTGYDRLMNNQIFDVSFKSLMWIHVGEILNLLWLKQSYLAMIKFIKKIQTFTDDKLYLVEYRRYTWFREKYMHNIGLIFFLSRTCFKIMFLNLPYVHKILRGVWKQNIFFSFEMFGYLVKKLCFKYHGFFL
ncbi:hypothetical protein ACJX0J_040847, partial [Zea mays]